MLETEIEEKEDLFEETQKCRLCRDWKDCLLIFIRVFILLDCPELGTRRLTMLTGAFDPSRLLRGSIFKFIILDQIEE